jgi:hypothetical protein
MYSNILWGSAFIMIGSSIILNKIYGMAIPFEVMVGLFFILLGVSKLFNIQKKHRS